MEKFMIFTGIFALLNSYVVLRLFSYAPYAGLTRGHAAVLILILTLIQMAPFLVSRITIDPGLESPILQKVLHVFYFVSYAVMGAFFCSLFYMIVADAFGLIAGFLAPDEKWPLIRNIVFYGVIIATFLTTAIGIVQASQHVRLVEVSVPIRNLPKALEGYKIIQISDLHVGPLIRKPYVDNLVETVNKTNPDMIALTGDLADGSVQELRDHIMPLSQLKSRDGNFFILGNHEYYWNLSQWMALYDHMGFKTLLNSHATILRNGAKLSVAGVTDYSSRHMPPPYATDISKAAAGIPQDAVKILLAHQPTDYRKAADAGFDLQLSGHTHGGQFFPWSVGFRLYHDFLYGLGKYKDMWIYVTRGAGYWGPPLRTFAPSEVVLLTLHAE